MNTRDNNHIINKHSYPKSIVEKVLIYNLDNVLVFCTQLEGDLITQGQQIIVIFQHLNSIILVSLLCAVTIP